jgi:hypothetical protein
MQPLRPALLAAPLLVALGLPGPASAADEPHYASKALEEFADYNSAEDDDVLEGRLVRWAKAGDSVARLEARTMAEYGVPEALAHELVALVLRSDQIQYDDDSSSVAERRRIEERRIALAAQYPDAWIAFEEAMRDVAPFDDCDGARIDALLATRPDPDAARLRLAPAIDCLQILSPTTSAPGAGTKEVVAFARKVDGWTRGAIGLATLRVALARVDADPAWPAADAAELRSQRLRRELAEGQLSAAIAALPAPGPVFDALVANLTGSERLDVAGAALAIGDAARARQWRALAEAEAPLGLARVDGDRTDGGTDEQNAKRLADEVKNEQVQDHLRKQMLAWALGERQGDPFALLVDTGELRDSPFSPPIWSELASAVARREGYPMLASRTDVDRADYVKREHDEAIAQCYRCAPDLLAAIESTFAAWAVRDPALPTVAAAATVPDTRPAELLARMDRAIDATATNAWIEQPLPPALRTQRDPDGNCRRCDGGKPPAWSARLPRGELVRWGQVGQRIVAITASQSLDPVGELSSGGYWLSVSDDRGATFGPPLYTGLHVFGPYVVRPASKLPLLDGDDLQLEVAVRELDPESITFPPVGVRFKREADDLVLRLPLAELQRDRDDDGLSDTVETAMLLDPDVADTDGDSIADGADMLPNVPWRDGAGNERAAALAVALDGILGKEFGAIVTTSAHAPAFDSALAGAIGTGTEAHNTRGVTFLHGPADAFAPLALRQQVVVLGDAQVARLQQARGAFYAIEIGGFALDRAGVEGTLWWSASWTGGSFRLHKRDGKWVAESTGSWITGVPAAAPALAAR